MPEGEEGSDGTGISTASGGDEGAGDWGDDVEEEDVPVSVGSAARAAGATGMLPARLGLPTLSCVSQSAPRKTVAMSTSPSMLAATHRMVRTVITPSLVPMRWGMAK